MYFAIIYKEWLKIRWVIIAFLGISTLVLLNIVLKLNHDLKFNEANIYWAYVIERGYLFYDLLKYLPIISGMVIALAQFIPENSADRLKLTLHLPVNEKSVVLQMTSVGAAVISILYFYIFFLLTLFISFYFPSDILSSVLITAVPWFLAGYAAYFLTETIVLEPIWLRRFSMIAISYGFLNIYLKDYWYDLYANSMIWFAILSLILFSSSLYSSERFRRGVM